MLSGSWRIGVDWALIAPALTRQASLFRTFTVPTVTAIIPARFGASRFPGKPLARDTGKYLIQHVCERVSAAETIERVIVATDDVRIGEAVRSFGGEVQMTRADHVSGTDRIAEVVERLGGEDDDLILNVQGDEPEIEPACLDQLVRRMLADRVDAGTLAAPFAADQDPADPNAVKVVVDADGFALYFSRALIPHVRDAGGGERPWLLHVGVYAYRRAFLPEYTGWAPTALEQLEKLEQLRILEHGRAIAVERTTGAPKGVDTPEDYARFVARRRLG